MGICKDCLHCRYGVENSSCIREDEVQEIDNRDVDQIGCFHWVKSINKIQSMQLGNPNCDICEYNLYCGQDNNRIPLCVACASLGRMTCMGECTGCANTRVCLFRR